MNVLIVYEGPLAEKLAGAIAQGAKELNAQVTLKTTKDNLSLKSFEFVLLGGTMGGSFSADAYIKKNDWNTVNVALFAAKTGAKGLELVADSLQKKGAKVEKNSFTARVTGLLSGLGMGQAKEADIIRARGFGERTLNSFFNLPFGSESEKSKIKGYLK